VTRGAKFGASGIALLVAACGGSGPEDALWCPNVEAVAGLDRLALAYPGADAPVPTRLDVLETVCIADGDDLLVGSSVAIRLGEGKPAGDVRVPYTVVLDGPAGPQDARTDVAVVPAGAIGTTTFAEHRFTGLAARDDLAVRLLYALVADEETRRRLAEDRPRP
jgi:hypothetical protein